MQRIYTFFLDLENKITDKPVNSLYRYDFKHLCRLRNTTFNNTPISTNTVQTY